MHSFCYFGHECWVVKAKICARTQLWQSGDTCSRDFFLLEDTKLKQVTKFLYTEKAFRPHALALLSQVLLYHTHSCSTSMPNTNR